MKTPLIYEEDGPQDYPGVPFEVETDVMEKHHNESGNEKEARLMSSASVDQSIRKTALDTAMANAEPGMPLSKVLDNARTVELYLRGQDRGTGPTPA